MYDTQNINWKIMYSYFLIMEDQKFYEFGLEEKEIVTHTISSIKLKWDSKTLNDGNLY